MQLCANDTQFFVVNKRKIVLNYVGSKFYKSKTLFARIPMTNIQQHFSTLLCANQISKPTHKQYRNIIISISDSFLTNNVFNSSSIISMINHKGIKFLILLSLLA